MSAKRTTATSKKSAGNARITKATTKAKAKVKAPPPTKSKPKTAVVKAKPKAPTKIARAAKSKAGPKTTATEAANAATLALSTWVRRMMANTPDAILVLDADATIVAANRAFLTATGHGLDRLIGEPFAERLLVADRHAAATLTAIADVANGERESARIDVTIRDAADAARARQASIYALPPGPSGFGRVALSFAEPTITSTAPSSGLVDPLTNLPSRELFDNRAQWEMLRADRDGRYVGIMAFSLDHLAPTVDAFGQAFGQVFLAQTAQRLADAVKPWDTVTRLGHDEEFGILVGELTDPRHIEPIAERILAAINGPVEHAGRAALLSGSLGIALYPRDGDNLNHLLAQARDAMRQAKHDGGGEFRYVTRSLQLIAERRIDLQRELRRAVVEHGLRLVYQPIVDLKAGKAVAVEALLRWRHPERGDIPPLEILRIADEIGLGPTIGDWVTGQAMADLVELRAAGAPLLKLTLNKTPEEMARVGVVEEWLALARRHGLAGEALILDLTEALFLDRDRDFLPEVTRWRQAGGLIALDDFSVGAASLLPLRKRAIDWIKLDGGLVQCLPDDDTAATIEAVVGLARRLGAKVMAEGVETTAQATFLKTVGCDLAQGRIFAPPMSAADLAASIRR